MKTKANNNSSLIRLTGALFLAAGLGSTHAQNLVGNGDFSGNPIGTTATADPLQDAFQAPPVSARPQTWWHWMDGNITKEGITADLEAMQRAGIGGAHIFNIVGKPPGPVRFMSEEWIALFLHSVREADRCGIQIGVANGPGWSASGGPWIDAAHNMQILTSSRTYVTGSGTEQTLVLPQPWSNLDYYRDVAVIAYPSGSTMVDAKPVITASAEIEGALLMDGRPDTQITLPGVASGRERLIQLEFPAPVTVKGLLLTHFGSTLGSGGEIQVSDDGRTFRTVARFDYSELVHFKTGQTQINFAPVTGKVFRLKFNQAGGDAYRIGEVELALTPTVQGFMPKAGYYTPQPGFSYERGDSGAVGPMLSPGQVVELTRLMDSSGRLQWSVPPGRWTVLRVGQTASGLEARPLPTGLTALECDKLSRPAVKLHYDGFAGRLAKLCGPLTGKVFTSVTTDSWEVGAQNWTAGLPEEFRKRRGYDLMPFLPLLLTGRVEDSVEASDQFLEDYRRTLQELLLENYFGYFTELCHRDGLQFWVENYHNVFCDTLEIAGRVDVAMAEFWANHVPDLTSFHWLAKHASSCSQVYGLPQVPAEAFTTHLDRWTECPKTLKAKGDLMYAGGINRMVFHSYAHQPWLDREPGMTMNGNGISIGRNSTWWEEGSAWMKYLERCQSLLQKGSVVGQVAILMPEYAPIAMSAVDARYQWIKRQLPKGISYLFCSPNGLLQKARLENGQVRFPLGEDYRLVVLPDTKVSSPELLTKIKELLAAGITVYATQRPDRAVGFRDRAVRDEKIQKLAADIWGAVDGKQVTSRKVGKGLLVQGVSLAEAARLAGIQPDFEFANADGTPVEAYNVGGNVQQVNVIHRRADGCEFYFVANHTQQEQRLVCRFGVVGMTPEHWNPVTGHMEKLAAWRETAGATELPLNLEPAESVFIVFRPTTATDPIISLQQAGKELFPAMTNRSVVTAVARDVVDNFTMAGWVKAGGAITLPVEVTTGISGVPECCTVYPVPGHEVFGADEAGAGFTVAANGITVMEHGAGRFVNVLVHPMTPGKDWIHVAVVYRDRTPTLYVNGQRVKSGLRGPMAVHPSVGVAHARPIAPFDGVVVALKSFPKPLGEAEIKALMEDTRVKTQMQVVIQKAVYGILNDPARTRDRTARVQALMLGESSSLPVLDMNVPEDPAPGVVKTLRVEYIINGQSFVVSGTEGQTLQLRAAVKSGTTLVVRKAVYGVLNDLARTRDMTARIQALVVGDCLSLPVMDLKDPEDPAPGVVKTLRVEYTANGESLVATRIDGQTLLLKAPVSRSSDWRLTMDAGGVTRLKTDLTGKFTATTASGKTWQVEAPVLPAPIVVSGPWQVDFQPGRGAPATAEFPRLISWSDHEDQGIRYFSGHATYHNQITVPPTLLGPDRRLLLNLGGVEVIAEVKVNGKDCGILWHAPYEVDVTEVLQAGTNELEIRVVNLWPNRIIGDLRNPAAKPFTYCQMQLYSATDALLPSGLLGPVELSAVSDLPVTIAK
jgi:hypothetical protein